MTKMRKQRSRAKQNEMTTALRQRSRVATITARQTKNGKPTQIKDEHNANHRKLQRMKRQQTEATSTQTDGSLRFAVNESENRNWNHGMSIH